MPRGDQCVRCSLSGYRKLFFLFPVLLVLFGCFESSIQIEPEIYQGDSLIETLQRYVTPTIYWQKKVVYYRELVEKERVAFDERNEAYQALLRERRDQVLAAVNNSKSGGDLQQIRKQVILSYRERMDQLRSQSRQHHRRLGLMLHLLEQSEIALADARG
ncbi:MAG: hypothetical protein H7832_01370 [Magnetococcus sp. DMHC-6]